MQEKTGERRPQYLGLSAVAERCGVSTQHVSQVVRGLRPGTTELWDAIEELGVRRGGVKGRLVRRPRAAAMRRAE